MNDEIEKLHTAIRQYCIDRYAYWTENYKKLNALEKGFSVENGYSDEALTVIPRYNVLNAILAEIERHRPADFSSFEEAKEFFTLAVTEAQNIFTKPPNEEIKQRTIDEERALLIQYITRLSKSDLSEVKSLYYRHVLSKSESDFVREKLKTIWNVKGYYYPLEYRTRDDIEAFQDKYFEKEFGFERLREILHLRGISRIWEMCESDENHEIELSIFAPNLSETFWCDANFDWLIYASHESSITFAGSILSEIKNNWTNWQQRVWTSPFFD
ncbi:MAG: hypothetical protein H0U87_05050 [Acidobacteria bacterium]|jgi:hypothetical protein|nr:hypothetical protein [Acidobacteriota bacterium]